jgi:carboxyl-terminal processing protease
MINFVMKKRMVFLVVFVSFLFSAKAQTFKKVVNDAFVISRMVEKYHVQPRPVDRSFSEEWFTEIINTLDNDKIFFTAEDINQVNIYRFQLQNQLQLRQSNFIQLLYNLYKIRLGQVDTMINTICKTPFDFTGNETLSVQEDTSYATDKKKLEGKLYKHLKSTVLYNLVEINEEGNSKDHKMQKRSTDSLEIVCRKKAQSVYKRFIKRQLESPGGLAESIGNIYCKKLAECYDPHTEFFPLTEKENFESALGNKKMMFGFKLEKNDDGQVRIGYLKPGSPAFKSGQLNSGDKLMALQWEGKEGIDVSDASIEEISRLLDESNYNKMTLSVKKTDGSTRQVILAKEKDDNNLEEDGRVKSFLLKGAKTIGFISLPNFYTDWKHSNFRIEGCANDISKEIIKLKKEKMDGLIIDLRYNGGGSMEEATELSGIFIDAGPVGQLVGKDGKVRTLKDINRGTIYDGPLLVLVNGSSASASEMVAGTLQDYNRAIIAGTTTYGKATAQIILPLDTTFNLQDENAIIPKTDSYLKLTIEKLYRVTGNTAQIVGIVPDVNLPELEGPYSKREADDKYSLRTKIINANKYFKPYAAINIKGLQTIARIITDTSAYFKSIVYYNNVIKQYSAPKDIHLNLDFIFAENKKNNNNRLKDIPGFKSISAAPYTVENHSYEMIHLKADKDLSEMNDQWKNHLGKDPYVQAAYQILFSFINLN